MLTIIRPLCVALVLLFSHLLNAEVISTNDRDDYKRVRTVRDSPSMLKEEVEENYTFYGLASYYNNSSYHIVSSDELHNINASGEIELKKGQWLAVVGRLDVLLIQGIGLPENLDQFELYFTDGGIPRPLNTNIQITSKPGLSSIASELDQIRYAHLWAPISWLAKVVELSLVAIQGSLTVSWGAAVALFSVLLKLVLLPVGVMTVHFQRRVSQIQAQLAPKLAEIKVNYDGEEAHNRLMAAHKELGVSPFYALKPMWGSFIQIPILIAVFNALGEMPQFVGQSFLWIGDLAYPDVIGYLPLPIPMFGNTISLLPFIMTAVTLYSTVIFRNRYASKDELRRQKRNLYLMAAVFFILFYPFPAVMVLYWTLSNALHTIQQQIIKI